MRVFIQFLSNCSSKSLDESVTIFRFVTVFCHREAALQAAKINR